MGQAGGAHSGERCHALQKIAIDPVEPVGCAGNAPLVTAPRLDSNDEHLVPIEAAILSVERLQAAHEEARREQEKEAEHYLRHDEDLSRTEPVISTDRPACLALDARDDVDA